jgi:hypothetical protein
MNIGFINYFNTQLVITLNCIAISDLYTSYILQVFLVCYETFPGNGSNNVYSSASGLKFPLNGGSLPAVSFLTTDARTFHAKLLIFSSPPFTLRKIPGTHFCERLSQPQDHSAAGRIRSIEMYNNLIGTRTRDIPACSIVPQLTTLSRVPIE